MATDLVDVETKREGGIGRIFDFDDTHWHHFEGRTYECRVLLCPEKEGGYSAHALRLPGVVSEGESLEEALSNIADAFQAAIQIYLSDTGSIPWADNPVERVSGCEERRILVNV